MAKLDSGRIKTHIAVELRDGSGRLLEQRRASNLIPSAGRGLLADPDLGNASTPITHCAVGSDGTTPTIADTGLGAEVDRNPVTYKSRSGGKAVFETFFSASEAIGMLRETGLFTAAAGGVMLGRAVFRAVNKTNTTTLTVKYEVEFTQ